MEKEPQTTETKDELLELSLPELKELLNGLQQEIIILQSKCQRVAAIMSYKIDPSTSNKLRIIK